MALEKYQKMRDFSKTPEPAGELSKGFCDEIKKRYKGKRISEKPIYVVQEHHASRLHWDFRIELDGVLKSWAIPKGPSTDPKDKRLAVQTENHPIEYANFEGEIPAGNYGAGTVKLWDSGDFEVVDRTPDKIVMKINGKRLQGEFVLLRTKFSGSDKNWLFFKKKG